MRSQRAGHNWATELNWKQLEGGGYSHLERNSCPLLDRGATGRGQIPSWLLVQLNPGPFLSKQNLLLGKDMVLVNHTSVWIWTQHSIMTVCRAVLRKILESIQGHQERPTMNKVHERVTHLRDQGCQICTCQWDIAGNLDRRPNGKGDKHRAEIGIPQHKE